MNTRMAPPMPNVAFEAYLLPEPSTSGSGIFPPAVLGAGVCPLRAVMRRASWCIIPFRGVRIRASTHLVNSSCVNSAGRPMRPAFFLSMLLICSSANPSAHQRPLVVFLEFDDGLLDVFYLVEC